MAVITPNSTIRIIKLPIELSDKNQLTFSNKTNQTNYFLGLNHLEMDHATYQRESTEIVFNVDYDTALSYNYVMYQNTSYSTKWFYAYIKNVRYLSNESCAIQIETDVFQTYQFDITYLKSFVEREHVTNDTAGLHTVPENLETGEYVSTVAQPTTSPNLEMCFCLTASENIFTSQSVGSQRIPTGLYYIGVENLDDIKVLVSRYDSNGWGDSINSVFVIPKEFFSNWSTATGLTGKVSTSVKFSTNNKEISLTKPTYLANNYTPKNKKLLTYPYSFLQVSNHNGTVINYNWEDFNKLDSSSNAIRFYLRGVLTPGGSFSAFPYDYKNILNNHDEAITLGKFPIGGFNTDTYTNWLTQNGVNLATNFIGQSVNVIGSALIPNPVGVTSGLTAIAQELGTVIQHSLVPDQARGNTNVGDYSYQFGLTDLEFKNISIKNEYAQIIDQYFNMYGYKINLVKVPNINTRRNWNFIKTIDANIHGYLPDVHLDRIKNLFNNGVTLWHNSTTFLDYSQANPNI